MTVSSYGGGFTNSITVRGLPLSNTYPGEVFFVNNSTVTSKDSTAGIDGNPATYRRPGATIQYTLTNKCKAGRGDVIICMPGHAETISTAGGLTISVNDVAILGLGGGQSTPKLTFTATAASIVNSANDTTFNNIRFRAGIASVVKAINNTGKNLYISSCVIDNTSTYSFVAFVSNTGTANTADGLTIVNCVHNQNQTTNVNFVVSAAAVDSLTFNNNQVTMGVSNNNAVVDSAGFAVTNFSMVGNQVHRLNTATQTKGILFNSSTTGNTGIIANNVMGCADAGSEVVYVGTGLRAFNNLVTSVDNTSGFLLPTADS
jgi:hypothetical protein